MNCQAIASPETTCPLADEEKSSSAQGCPRCGKPLTDGAGLGWCQACGYCRSLEEGAKQLVDKPTGAPPVVVTEASNLVRKTPMWFLVLLVGLVFVVGGSYAVGKWLAPTGHGRALWTTLQLAGGLLLLFLAQFIALVRLAPFDETLSFKDALFPGRLWAQAWKRLPAYGFNFCFAAWAMAAFTCALLFIGGLHHWFSYLPSNQKNVHNIRR